MLTRTDGRWVSLIGQDTSERTASNEPSTTARTNARFGWLVAVVPLVPLVAIAAGVYAFGREHTPDYSGTGLFGRTAQGTLPLKSWLATSVLGLAVFQLGSALWMYRVLPALRTPPQRLGIVHRVSGVALVLVTLPVAYHCVLAYGVQKFGARITAHSLAGCFFYGAFAAKLTIVHSKRLPGWMLPLAGGTLVVLVVLLWYTSALWYFNNYHLPIL